MKARTRSPGPGSWIYAWILFLSLLPCCGKQQIREVRVTGDKEVLMVGESGIFRATALDISSNAIPDVQFQWSVEGDAGSIDQSGRFSAQRPGEVYVIATSSGIRGGVKIRVKSFSEPGPVAKREGVSDTITSLNDTNLPDLILIDNPVYESDARGPVAFGHARHTGLYHIACTQCHHEYEQGANIWKPGDPVKNCRKCHSPKTEEQGPSDLQTTYHRSCRDCHKQVSEESKSEIAPWRRCAGCHRKLAEETSD